MRHFHRTAVILFVAVAGSLALPLWGQQNGRFHGERVVEKKPNAEDPDGTWMLDFRFKDPRYLKVSVAGERDKGIWYLYYQVSNNTGAPRQFFPSFVWVVHDENTVHEDQLIPAAQQAVQRLEDPSGRLNIQNSVSITAQPIPFVKEFDEQNMRISFPKLIYGVATWDDINPKCDRFSIFVYGLSNGALVVDGPDGKPILRRKTLQLKFKRLGDEFTQSSEQIRYAGQEWIYATADVPSLAKYEDAAKK